jgi:hypothetical protein
MRYRLDNLSILYGDRQRQHGDMSPNVSTANGRAEGDRQRQVPLGTVVLSPPAMTLEVYPSKHYYHTVTRTGCDRYHGSFPVGDVCGVAESPPRRSSNFFPFCISEKVRP